MRPDVEVTPPKDTEATNGYVLVIRATSKTNQQ